MSDGWSFETRQIHAGQAARRRHRRPRPADLPDDVLRLQRRRARGEPVRAQGVRQHLHADHEPDAGRRRAAHRQPRGRRRRAARRERPGRRDAGASSTSPRPATTSSSQPEPVRRHLQPASTTRCPSSASRSTFVEDPDDLESWRARGPAQHQGVLRRDHLQPEAGRPRHRGCRRRRPRGRRPAHRRQHRRHAVPDPPDRVGRRHRRALDDQVPRRPRHRRSAASSSTAAAFDYAAHPERFPDYNQPDPSYHGLVYARDLGVGSAARRQPRLHPQGPGAAAARPRARRPRRSTPSCSPQGLETLSLRIERHVAQRAGASPSGCEGRDEVESVAYAGPAVQPLVRARRRSTRPRAPGAVLAFEIKGGLEAGKRFVEALELHSHVANIGDVRSLVIHPASTTHSQLLRGGAAGDRRHARPGPARGRASSTSTTSWPTSRRASARPRTPERP